MLEAEQPLVGREQMLETLLSEAALREKRSRRRAILYTIIPIIAGLTLLAISLYKVRQLEQTATNLNVEIDAKKREIGEAQKTLAELNSEKESTKADLEVIESKLRDIKEGHGDPKEKAKSALNVITKTKDELSINAKTSKGTEKTAGPSTPAANPSGKFDGKNYTGSNGTKITVEVMAEGAPIDLYYTLDGNRVEKRIDGMAGTSYRFDFILDKTKHNPSRLLMNFDFSGKGGELGKCTVKITDGNGVSYTYRVLEKESMGPVLIGFSFNIV